MDNRTSQRERPNAFDAYRAEPIIYCGYAVRRGFALLMEDELSGNIDRLIEIGNAEVASEPALPDSHARDIIYPAAIDADRNQYDFLNPYWGRKAP